MVRSMARWALGALAVGAVIALPGSASAAEKKVTFSKDVAPIFQSKCISCHEPGSIAPMSLRTYEDARPWARSIKNRVSTRQMPPWHLNRSVGVQEFKNDMSLTDEQIDTIVAWVDQGAPQGDPKDMPALKPVTDKLVWQGERDGYGPPDIIVRGPRATMPRSARPSGGTRTEIPLNEPRWARMVGSDRSA